MGPAVLLRGGRRGDVQGGGLVIRDGGDVRRVPQRRGRAARVAQGQVDGLIALQKGVVDRGQGGVLDGAGGGAAVEGDALGAQGAVVGAAARRARARVHHVGGQR